MADAFEHKVPKQESADQKRLREDPKSPRDLAPDLQPLKEQEAPGGPLGAVVKDDYQVDPTASDEPGNAEAVADADGPKKSRSSKKKAAPDELREEMADLQQKVDTGRASPKDKIRLSEARTELDEATKPAT